MLRTTVDNPGKCDKDVQRKIVGFWIDRLNPGLAAYNDGDEYTIDPGMEAGARLRSTPKTIAITQAQAEAARLLVETADKWGEPVPAGVRAMARAATIKAPKIA